MIIRFKKEEILLTVSSKVVACQPCRLAAYTGPWPLSCKLTTSFRAHGRCQSDSSGQVRNWGAGPCPRFHVPPGPQEEMLLANYYRMCG